MQAVNYDSGGAGGEGRKRPGIDGRQHGPVVRTGHPHHHDPLARVVPEDEPVAGMTGDPEPIPRLPHHQDHWFHRYAPEGSPKIAGHTSPAIGRAGG